MLGSMNVTLASSYTNSMVVGRRKLLYFYLDHLNNKHSKSLIYIDAIMAKTARIAAGLPFIGLGICGSTNHIWMKPFPQKDLQLSLNTTWKTNSCDAWAMTFLRSVVRLKKWHLADVNCSEEKAPLFAEASHTKAYNIS